MSIPKIKRKIRKKRIALKITFIALIASIILITLLFPKEISKEISLENPAEESSLSSASGWEDCQSKRKIPQRRICFSNAILENSDPTLCNTLDEDTRASCLGTLHATGYKEEQELSKFCPDTEACYMGYGFGSKTIDACSGIDDTYYKDNCIFGVAIRNKEPNLCKGLEMQDFCYWYLARDIGNSSLCLKAGTWEEDCLFRFVVKDLSISGLTKDICDKLPTDQKIVCYALEEKDPELCEVSDKWAGECYTRLAVASNNQSLCSKAVNKEEYCLWNIALQSGNTSTCEKLKAKKELCYMDLAIQKKDETLCDKTGPYQENCYFEVVMKKDIENVCKDMPNPNQCYFYKALQNKDPSVCDKSGRYKNYCYALLAEETGNAAFCNKSDEYKDICYTEVAALTTDISLCDKTKHKEECIYSVAEKAIEEIDPTICDEAGYLKDACYFEIAAKQDDNLCNKAGSLEQACKERKKLVNETDKPLPDYLLTHQDNPLKPKEGDL